VFLGGSELTKIQKGFLEDIIFKTNKNSIISDGFRIVKNTLITQVYTVLDLSNEKLFIR